MMSTIIVNVRTRDGKQSATLMCGFARKVVFISALPSDVRRLCPAVSSVLNVGLRPCFDNFKKAVRGVAPQSNYLNRTAGQSHRLTSDGKAVIMRHLTFEASLTFPQHSTPREFIVSTYNERNCFRVQLMFLLKDAGR